MKLLRKRNLDELNDEELWHKVLQKDYCALESLYKRYFSTLYNYGLRFTSNEDVVKDAIQELFVHLLSKSELNEVNSVRAYLMVALRNAIFKVKLANQPLSLDEVPFQFLISDDELLNHFSKDDEAWLIAKQLKKAYQLLNSNQRHVIYLYYIKNCSWEETAAILNITPHSCMNLVRRAVNKLHMLMTNEASSGRK